jgi:enterochelin esterase-like enzyme
MNLHAVGAVSLALGFQLLVGCQPVIVLSSTQLPATTATSFIRPASQPTPIQSACEQPGTVQTLTVDGFGDIGLYLPPCDDPQAQILYPVLYLLPGFGGTYMEWLEIGLTPLTDRAIVTGELPPFLIVTTDNTYDAIRTEDIVTVLLPYMESHYPVKADRLHRAIAGGSLGGGSAYVLTFQHPELFANAGVFGNGLITGLETQTDAWLSAIPQELKPRVFLNSGEQDTHMLEQARLLIPLLDKYGIKHSEIFNEGGHSTVYWLSNFPIFYQWLAEDWQE